MIDCEDYFWYWIKTVLDTFRIESTFDTFKMRKVVDTFSMKTVSWIQVFTFQVQNCIDVWCHQGKQVQEGRKFSPSIHQLFFRDRKSMLILVFQSVHGSLGHWIFCHSIAVHPKYQSYHFHHHSIHSLDSTLSPSNRDRFESWLRSKCPTKKMALTSSQGRTSMVVLLTFSREWTDPGLILSSNHSSLSYQSLQTGAEIVAFQVTLLLHPRQRRNGSRIGWGLWKLFLHLTSSCYFGDTFDTLIPTKLKEREGEWVRERERDRRKKDD